MRRELYSLPYPLPHKITFKKTLRTTLLVSATIKILPIFSKCFDDISTYLVTIRRVKLT